MIQFLFLRPSHDARKWLHKYVRGKRDKRGKSVRRGVFVPGCRPEGGGPPLTLRLLAGDSALSGELFEGDVDALAADMAVKEGSYLIAG